MEVIAALRAEPGRDEDLAVTVALLHDVVEDTTTPLGEIEAQFGPRVAAGVSALTKNKALGKVAMEDSLARIQGQPTEIAMVKLADRVTNLAPPPVNWPAAKVADYREQGQLILDRLRGASPFLSARLVERLGVYPAGVGLPGGRGV
jgi:(p)ppGpp synthase/HD superfamily hydrolase